MPIELPVLRLGLAGFTATQQQAAEAALQAASTSVVEWEMSPFADADAWWLDGARTQLLPSGMVRVSPGVLSARSVQLAMAEVDRPVAFSEPVAAPGFAPPMTFDLADAASTAAVLRRFAALLQPLVAQYCLAASIAEHQPSLGSGSWELLRGADLLGVVDLAEGTGVAPDVTPRDMAEATWCIRDRDTLRMPGRFVRSSLSQLMWLYALRTQQDLLPPHYRTRPLFFRRPPRLQQRQLKDAHLLLLRELVAHPGQRFDQLQRATGFGAEQLARHLAALYFVGSITANARRASGLIYRASDASDAQQGQASSVMPSVLDSGAPPLEPLLRARQDLTAPIPLLPE